MSLTPCIYVIYNTIDNHVRQQDLLIHFLDGQSDYNHLRTRALYEL